MLFNPVYDNGPGGYGYDRVKDYWEVFSPMHNLHADVPPTIVFLGTKDNLIPVATAEKYQRLMKEAGVRSDLHLFADQPHGFFNLSRSRKNFDETVKHMDAFLVSLGYLEKN